MEKPTIEIDLNEKTPEQYLAEYCHKISQQSLDFTKIWKNEKISKLSDEIFEIISKNGVINKMEPVKCGCGGEVKVDTKLVPCAPVERKRIYCSKCYISTEWMKSEAEAIMAWNRAMGSTEKSSVVERTAKVMSDDVIITVNGYRYHYEEYLCNACKKKVFSRDSYCSHCGAKLDWGVDE